MDSISTGETYPSPVASPSELQSHSPTIPYIHSSTLGMLRVVTYTPTEGEQGVPITVRIDFSRPSSQPAYVRLVLGNRALATRVRPLPDAAYGKWQLEAAAPPFDRHQFPSTEVPMTVQALAEQNQVIDSLTFGSFKYWESECDCPEHPETSRRDPELAVHSRSPSTNSPPCSPPSSTTSPITPPSRSRQGGSQTSRTKEKSYVMRRRSPGVGQRGANERTPKLEILSQFDRFTRNWNESEFAVGRRLIRFTRVQEGQKLIVTCEPIRQESYRERDIVISCIYWRESDCCVFTSVDIIYLLESLVGHEFEVAEKNRIRRNLEGLRPTTISKTKPQFEDFYHRLMDFPDPQPRKIEKDLKVFDWDLLGQALDKIISKYSLHPNYTERNEHPLSYPTTGVRPPSPKRNNLDDAPTVQPADLRLEVSDFKEEDNMRLSPQVYSPPSVSSQDYQIRPGDITVTPSAASEMGYFSRPVSVAHPGSSTILEAVMVAAEDQTDGSTPGSWISSSGGNSTMMSDEFLVEPDLPLNSFGSDDFAVIRGAYDLMGEAPE